MTKLKDINQKPIVSVIMPVYNAAEFLPQSIESVLNQTFSNFEFIIVDDASTDNSWKIIKSYASKDKRIIPIKNRINLGVSLTSNIAISIAKGKFLARMDADDISLPHRLEQEINFLTTNPSVIAVGGQCTIIDEFNRPLGKKTFPTLPSDLRKMIFWAIPMQQPSMMVNLSRLPKNFTWYSQNKSSAEEVDLFFHFMSFGDIANLNDEVLLYRHLSNSLSHRNPKETFKLTLQSRFKALKNGFKPSFWAVIINLIQILIISIFPSQIILSLWYFIRGVKKISSDFVGIPTSIKV
jgi:glycosyltransferase involved in cell wall biosynthesis